MHCHTQGRMTASAVSERKPPCSVLSSALVILSTVTLGCFRLTSPQCQRCEPPRLIHFCGKHGGAVMLCVHREYELVGCAVRRMLQEYLRWRQTAGLELVATWSSPPSGRPPERPRCRSTVACRAAPCLGTGSVPDDGALHSGSLLSQLQPSGSVHIVSLPRPLQPTPPRRGTGSSTAQRQPPAPCSRADTVSPQSVGRQRDGTPSAAMSSGWSSGDTAGPGLGTPRVVADGAAALPAAAGAAPGPGAIDAPVPGMRVRHARACCTKDRLCICKHCMHARELGRRVWCHDDCSLGVADRRCACCMRVSVVACAFWGWHIVDVLRWILRYFSGPRVGEPMRSRSLGLGRGVPCMRAARAGRV